MEDKDLLEGIVEKYYNSVQELFRYRIKHEWKFTLSLMLFLFSFFFVFLSAIPIFPFLFENYLNFIFKPINQYFDLGIQEYNFLTRWLVGTITSVLTLGILYLPYKYWDVKETKKALNRKQMTFCYAFSLLTELKKYLINDNEMHLENTSKYFNNIISSFTDFQISNGSKYLNLGLPKLREEILKRFDWFGLTRETNEIIKAISSVDKKVIERLKQKIELDKIIPILESITLYEFSKIKPDEKDMLGKKLRDKRNNYLEEFAERINILGEIENVTENKRRKVNYLKTTVSLIIDSFTSSNILVLFSSWLVFLTIIFVIVALIVVNITSLKMDTTLLTGILTVPFIGAITFTTAIYSKNKN